ncbi:30S ribosomal protein S7 [Candidatus Hepatoplasma crinochetorum]|uniref:Small ribosomal subunit protein uS7 n=1 Tax=Candidatus Hepatoplasma crinochetorum Av TaxID=1427984 RepID=W8GEY1_9MOLU|nr:30S ribosomal protein S7 [Candidatus Hepatoplasma crinochetorum]AHK22158.1 30S ribosomal protein S7 [Candidatus Hepatoplasma crinochetorum Av]BDV02744.1 MAG: 30S ribosomal protein S7 [Candidatus Hepatoplasma crinochetorum]
MSRKSQAPKRDVLPDPIYNSKNITKLVNNIMLDGKKAKAEKILYNAFKIIEKETNKKAMDIFNKALDNIMPTLELKVRRIGGANYQIPVPVNERRRKILALRWLTNYARLRNEKTMEERLAHEIIAASKNEGATIKKKQDTHKMAEANKAFAHFRW